MPIGSGSNTRGQSRRLAVVALLAGVALTPVSLEGQLLTTRGLFVAAQRDSVSKSRVLPRAELLAEFEYRTVQAKTYASSSYKLATLVDVVRLTRTTALSVLLATEMTFAPDNSLGFDPRGVVWEEQLALFGRTRSLTWSVATFLRCRHDVDNGTPIEPLPESPTILARGRTIVLPGTQIGLSGPEWRPTGRLALRLGGTLEGYIAPEDRRTPITRVSPQWSDAVGALGLTIRARLALHERAAIYARSWQSHVLFNESAGAGMLHQRTNARAELGLRLRGPGGGADLFVVRERTFDDVMAVQPRRFAATSIGVRLSGESLF